MINRGKIGIVLSNYLEPFSQKYNHQKLLDTLNQVQSWDEDNETRLQKAFCKPKTYFSLKPKGFFENNNLNPFVNLTTHGTLSKYPSGFPAWGQYLVKL